VILQPAEGDKVTYVNIYLVNNKYSTNCVLLILGKWPTWRTILFYVFIFIFNSLHVSSTSCSSSGQTNCVNTTSGSCHSVSVAVSCAGRKFGICRAWLLLPLAVAAQFVSPDDEHDVLETCRELKIKISTQKRIVGHVGHLPRIITWCMVNKI